MADACPSDYALEESLIDPETAAAKHASTCPNCRDRLARMEDQRVVFTSQIRPATLDYVLENAGGIASRRRWWSWLTIGGAGLATAAAFAFLLVPRPVPVTEHVKGLRGTVVAPPADPLVLQVFSGQAGVAHPARNGDDIPADASLRFRVAVPAPCQLAIVSIDSTGTISHLYPAGAAAKELAAGKSDLEGSAQLDGFPGPERLFAVCTPGPFAADDLAQAIRKAVRGPGLTSPDPLALGESALQTTLLLNKTK